MSCSFPHDHQQDGYVHTGQGNPQRLVQDVDSLGSGYAESVGTTFLRAYRVLVLSKGCYEGEPVYSLHGP